MREVKSRYAILGMLSIAPMSGYDIKKEVETSISNFWTESYGQIYPVLKSLIAEKLVTKTVESEGGKPDRHVYALTAKGRKELRRWLLEGSAPKVQRNEFLLKLFFGEEIPAKANIAHVENFRELQRGLLKKYAAIEKQITRENAGNPNLPYWLMTISYGQHVSRALVHWCDKTLAELARIAKSGSGTKR
ncbi:MAG: PadR family transcriptional regulator [Chthoniobacterales bacterium]|jgi:DNA-binding PadR family transcriptional regulator|nr:PadR family transcriptional regulator [Chthoniobacterales bacterium]